MARNRFAVKSGRLPHLTSGSKAVFWFLFDGNDHGGAMSELIDNGTRRKELLKHMILQLHQGERRILDYNQAGEA
jgi:hypothetical protein